jgi:hypothetical protein
LNGQQFTGHPLNFRYYDVRITEISPPIGPTEGGTLIKLQGTGMYDSSIKKLKFATPKGIRMVAANWERKDKSISCVVPPLKQLFKNRELSDQELKEIIDSGVKLSLTFNNQEWIDVPQYKYHDISVTRIAYVTNFAEDIESEEEKEKLWKSEQPIEEAHAEATEEEIKKWEEERLKRSEEEREETRTVAKRIGARLYIYGKDFINLSNNLKLKFILGEKIVEAHPIFKNSEKLA